MKRKRVFRRTTKKLKYLSAEQKEEIDNAFLLFDKDKSNTIDVVELRNAMKALGIHLTKAEVYNQMKKVDKDGSGFVDKAEFLGLMAEIITKRDEATELKKVFRMYDNDDDGEISVKNIWECADQLEMEHLVNDERAMTMIEMADRKGKGGVD